MSFITSQHLQDFENFWVSNSGATQTGVTSAELAEQAIALFSCDANCAEENRSIAGPSFKKTKRFKLKLGVKGSSLPDYLSRQNSTLTESMCFDKDQIVSFSGQATEIPNKYNWKQHKIAIGYDGFDASKSLAAKLDDKPVVFTFILQGDPIQRYFGQNQVSYEYAVSKNLCLGDCDCFDACGKVDCRKLLEGLKKAIEIPLPKVLSTGAVVKRPITDFVSLSYLSKCTSGVPVAPATTEFSKYEISICDDGKTTLSQLAATYPGMAIKLESRKDGVSTYSFWQSTAAAAPVDFVIASHVMPICGVCPTCPDTYTPQAGVKNVQVTVACGAAAPALTEQISATKISSTLNNGDVYIIAVPLATTDLAIETQLDALACINYSILGSVENVCLGTDKTFTWKACKTCFKQSKNFMITLPVESCPASDHLVHLQAAYPNNVVALLQTSTTGCFATYSIAVDSKCYTTSIECFSAEPDIDFLPPTPYKGQAWGEVVTIGETPDCTIPAEVTDCCVCGLVVEGKAFMKDTLLECDGSIQEHNPGDVLGVRVHVTAYTYDPTGNPCNVTKEYVTQLQQEKIPSGHSGSQVRKYERSRLAYENKYFSGNPALDQANAFYLTAKEGVWYDHYRLVLASKIKQNRLMEGVENIAYNFFFPRGLGKQFEALINPLVAAAGKDVVIL